MAHKTLSDFGPFHDRRAAAMVARAAITQLAFSSDRFRVDFDHGAWWVTSLVDTRQWYAEDTADGIRLIAGRMES